MLHDLRAETLSIEGSDGDFIEAYFAQPLTNDPVGGVVVIHHLPGYDSATKEITRKFASKGYLAVCPNLYSREAPGASSDDAAATARALGGVPDERLVGDVGGAMAFLRSRDNANGKVASIGYCSGGRQSVLAACSLDLDAAVDCYGGFVVMDTPEGLPFSFKSLIDKLPNLACPLLGLFGAQDQYPSPEQTEILESILKEHGKTYEFHTYENAGHAFFAPDRPSYRTEAANEGWMAIWKFFDTYLTN